MWIFDINKLILNLEYYRDYVFIVFLSYFTE